MIKISSINYKKKYKKNLFFLKKKKQKITDLSLLQYPLK